jgi:hypothetical protein
MVRPHSGFANAVQYQALRPRVVLADIAAWNQAKKPLVLLTGKLGGRWNLGMFRR